MPVNYTDTRVQWDTRKIIANGGFTEAQADVIATTKSAHWQYEEEVRVAVPLSDDTPAANGLYFCSVFIKGIVVGAYSKLTSEEIRRALPRGHSVRVTHARLAFRSFNVVRRRDIPITRVASVHR